MDQQLSTLLEERVADVPVGAPPIDAMRAAVRRRRSRATVLAAAAAVAVIAAGTVVWQVDRAPDLQPPVASDSPADPDTPPAGHRYVGIGTAVIAVPEAWGTNRANCGTPTEDTVVIDQGVICLLMMVERPADVDSVEVRPYYEGDDIGGWTEGEIDGEPALWSPVGAEHGVTSASVYIPSQKATFVAESSSANATHVVQELLSGIAILQEHTTVPGFNDLSFDTDPQPAVESYTERLQELGLSIEVISAARAHNIVKIDPAPGSVVAPGDTVRVTVAR